jgi:hypothetical protein
MKQYYLVEANDDQDESEYEKYSLLIKINEKYKVKIKEVRLDKYKDYGTENSEKLSRENNTIYIYRKRDHTETKTP